MNVTLEKIVNLCKRRGFIFPGSDIYGGLSNTYDFGPLGVELKNNFKRLWWKKFVHERGDVIGLESGILMNPKVWEASGHLKNFTDPLVECHVCHMRFRADKPEDLKSHQHQDFTPAKNFNLMFKSFVGPAEDSASEVYLRPETAQGMCVDFGLVLDTMRQRVPFGIAQIGKSLRNGFTAGNFVFRVIDFEIAEIEYFTRPGDDERAFDEWLEFMEKFLVDELGLSRESLRRFEHPKDSLAHYSKRTADIQYKFPWGWDELWGLANRTDFDLKQHEALSGQNMKYRDPETSKEYYPYVIEPTGGAERTVLAMLLDAYSEIEGGRTTTTDAKKEQEVVLKLKKKLAPVAAAILPLSKKPELQEVARKIASELRTRWNCQYDETGSIGRRYRRQDEIGTPFCITVDFDSLEDKKATVRDRDTMAQERVAIAELTSYISDQLGR